MQMKALTIYQPYASLIAVGAKRFETRSRQTHYRGRIAIHAGVKPIKADLFGNDGYGWSYDEWLAVHDAIGIHSVTGLPYGAIIATAELVGCHTIEKHPLADRPVLGMRGGDHKITENELLFGDWRPGRFAWELTDVKPLDKPIPMRGQQGLWNVELEVV